MGPGPDEETPEERRRRQEEERRRRRGEREDASDAVDGAADVAEAASGWGVPTGCGGRGRGGGSDGWGCGGTGGGRGGGSGCGSGGGGGRAGGGCDGCDCNLSLLSTLLLLAATVLPDPGTRSLVHGSIRLYQCLLTRFTPRCPSTPSCSAYASTAVRTLGTRHGLAAAAHRVRHCGRPR